MEKNIRNIRNFRIINNNNKIPTLTEVWKKFISTLIDDLEGVQDFSADMVEIAREIKLEVESCRYD